MVMETVADLKLTVKEPDQEKKQEEGQESLLEQTIKGSWVTVRAQL